jgi:hypothetical protein
VIIPEEEPEIIKVKSKSPPIIISEQIDLPTPEPEPISPIMEVKETELTPVAAIPPPSLPDPPETPEIFSPPPVEEVKEESWKENENEKEDPSQPINILAVQLSNRLKEAERKATARNMRFVSFQWDHF